MERKQSRNLVQEAESLIKKQLTQLQIMKNLVLKTVFLLALCVSQFAAFAGLDEVEGINTGFGLTADLTTTSARHAVIVSDPTWVDDFGIASIANKITFGIDQFMPQVDDAYAYKIVFDLGWQESDLSTPSLTDIELELNYDPDGAYQDQEVYTFTGGLEVTLSNIRLYKKDATGTYVLTPVDRDNLFLRSVIETTSYDDFDYLLVPPSVPVGLAFPAGESNLKVEWDPIPGAEAYDLEWTWVNSYKGTTDAFGVADLFTSSEVRYDFENNASRIRVTGTTYKIPLIYGDGFIVVRYRGVGKILGHLDKNVDGAWMAMPAAGFVSGAPTNCYVEVAAHEGNAMNYGATMTFVEDGTRNTGVSYLDGVMKSRQTASQLNSQEELMVGATIYDYYGRPALAVMGSPVKQTELGYVERLNMADTTNPYDKEIFHSDDLLLGACGPKAAVPMDADNSKGSANYYSEFNSNKEGSEAYVPEANGYNFTQIHYTNDATGRVKRTGNVGPDHQLGAEGHYSETIFGVAEGNEVDKFLGSEAAHTDNYTKIITKDVHGQISVSILDNAGRVVIAYLEGNAPAGLEAIEGNDGPATDVVELVGLTTSSSELEEQGILQVEKKIPVTDPEVVYTFNYDFQSLSYTECLPPDVCFDCVYEIEFEVVPAEGVFTSECPLKKDGEVLTSYSWTHTIGNITSFDITCDDPILFSAEYPAAFTLQFPRFGEYTVRKTLKVSQAPIEYYWEEFVANADESCITPYSSFLLEAMMNIDFSDCYDGSPCELGFLFTYGTVEEYIAETGETAAEYNALKEEYLIDCENQPICAQMLPILLSDVSPGGQYGAVTGASGLSVFNSADPLTFNWRTVDFYEPDGTTPSKMFNSEGVFVDVNHSTITLTEFLSEWSDHWAEYLLVGHPEYETYRFCELYSSVFDYALSFQLTETYADALAAGYITPVDPTNATYAASFGDAPEPYTVGDPLVLLMDGPLSDELDNNDYIYDDSYVSPLTVNNYLTSAQQILGISPDDISLYQVASALTDGAPFGSSSCDLDAQWVAFRDLYLARRNIVLQVVMEGRSVDVTPSGERIQCIAYADCGSYLLYHEKVKRFPLFDQLMPYPLIQILDGDPAALAGMSTTASAEVDEFCASTCASMADGWMSELAGCATTMVVPSGLVADQIWAPIESAVPGEEAKHAFYELIKAQLITVCTGGCSPEYPLPSQYHLPDPPSPELASFQTVLAQYLPGGIETLTCSHLLVDFPSAVQETSLTEKLSDCACDKLLSVSDEIAFETAFGFVPVEFCKDRAACVNAKPGLSIDLTYPEGSITWSTAEEDDLQEIVTFTDYGCNGDGCINCAMLDGAVTAFQTAFPGATIEENAVMFTSFVNSTFGTAFDYFSLSTFRESCEAIASGGVITSGGTAEVDDLIGLLNAMVIDDLLSISTYGNAVAPFVPLPQYFNSSFYTCSTVGHWGYIPSFNAATGGLSFNLNPAELSGFPAPCNRCPKPGDPVTILPEAPGWAGYVNATELYNNILSFTEYYFNASDLASGPAPDSPVTFHLKALVNDPLGGDPITVDFAVSNRCFNAYAHNATKLCSNYTIAYEDHCEDALIASAELLASAAYGEYLAAKKEEFVANYISTCRQVEETYNYEFNFNRYHYTLSYYDRAGNLMKTVPPKGVVPLSDVEIAQVQAHRAGDAGAAPVFNNHTFVTSNTFNSMNQTVTNTTPDGGSTRFWYDHLARLVASQDAKQANLRVNEVLGDPLTIGGAITKAYSYIRHDDLGRVIESGEFVQPTILTKAIAKDPSDFANWLFETGPGRYRNQVSFMNYSTPSHSEALAELGGGAHPQGDIRNALTSTSTVQGYTPMATTSWEFPDVDYANHYQYDVHGNVSTYLQEVKALTEDGRQFFRTDYDYDLLSGLPHQTHFQKGKADQYSHKYTYDADNRLESVSTSKDGVIWDKDANYKYRLDGMLARTELGDLQVQGCDYAYTLLGWLKGMNSAVLDPFKDMGNDGAQFTGSLESLSSTVAQDALAFTMGYYENDYQAIDAVSGNNYLATVSAVMPFKMDQVDLYNGNINHVITSIMDLEEQPIEVTGTTYRYDQLHRFKESHVFSAADITTLNSMVNAQRQNLTAGTHNTLGDYEVHVDYDQNGNILALDRRAFNKATVTDNRMDEFSYNYPSAMTNNLLGHVGDNIGGTSYNDIKNTQLAGNYEYFENGTLKSDKDEQIGYLEWYPSGKLKRIYRTDVSPLPDVYFEYDAVGGRMLKVEMPKNASFEVLPEEQWNYTWYGVDGNGVSLAVYQKSEADNQLHRAEASMYGTKRLGLDTRKVPIELTTGNYNLDETVLGGNCVAVGNLYINSASTHAVTDVNSDAVSDLTVNSASGTPIATLTIATEIGATYTVSYDLLDLAVPFIFQRSYSCSPTVNTSSNTVSTIGSHSFTFMATTTKSLVQWRSVTIAGGGFTISNINISGPGDVYAGLFGGEDAPLDNKHQRVIGAKMYELSDHLGNVKSVITDRKLVVGRSETYSLDDFKLGHSCDIAGGWGFNAGSTNRTLEDVDLDGEMDLTISNTSGFYGHVVIHTVPGSTYTVNFDLLATNTTIQAWAFNCSGGILGGINVSEVGSYSYTFLAASDQSRIRWTSPSPGSFTLSKFNVTGEGAVFGEPSPLSSYNFDDFVSGFGCTTPGVWAMFASSGNTWSVGDFDTDGASDLTVTNASTGFQFYQTLNTIVGEVYTVRYDLLNKTVPNVNVQVVSCSGGSSIGGYNAITTGSYAFSFVAEATQTRVYWYCGPTAGTVTIGGLSVEGEGPIYGTVGTPPPPALAYLPDVVSFQDYYPYGMEMPGRKGSLADYRYAFNGMERDNEVSGSGNSYTTMFRQYDPRLGRWKSVDPAQEALFSPYSGMDDNPIRLSDPLGLWTEKGARRRAAKLNKKGMSAFAVKSGKKWGIVIMEQASDGSGMYSKHLFNGLLTKKRLSWSADDFLSYSLIEREVVSDEQNYLNTRDDPNVLAGISNFHSYVAGLERNGVWNRLTSDQRRRILSASSSRQQRDAWNNFGKYAFAIALAPLVAVGIAEIVPIIINGSYATMYYMTQGAYVSTILLRQGLTFVGRTIIQKSAIQSGVLNYVTQLAANKGDATKVDLAGVLIAAFTGGISGESYKSMVGSSVLGGFLDASFDYSIDGGFKSAFSKSSGDFGRDFFFGTFNNISSGLSIGTVLGNNRMGSILWEASMDAMFINTNVQTNSKFSE